MGITIHLTIAYGTILLNPNKKLSSDFEDFMNGPYGKFFEMSEEMSNDKRYSVFVYLKSTEIDEMSYKTPELSWSDYEEYRERIDRPTPLLSEEERKAVEQLQMCFTINEPFFWMETYLICR